MIPTTPEGRPTERLIGKSLHDILIHIGGWSWYKTGLVNFWEEILPWNSNSVIHLLSGVNTCKYFYGKIVFKYIARWDGVSIMLVCLNCIQNALKI